MTADAIRELLNKHPFEPFTLVMSNGERHEVRHPENTIVMPSRLLVADPATDRLAILSLFHINEIHVRQPAGS
ncbi:MAG TPA: hypothetical protein VF170_13600 [Planctomycetaceae bacterium]